MPPSHSIAFGLREVQIYLPIWAPYRQIKQLSADQLRICRYADIRLFLPIQIYQIYWHEYLQILQADISKRRYSRTAWYTDRLEAIYTVYDHFSNNPSCSRLVCDRTGFSSFGRNRNSALQIHRTTVTEPNHLQNRLVSAEPASFGRKVAISAKMWLVLHKM